MAGELQIFTIYVYTVAEDHSSLAIEPDWVKQPVQNYVS